MGSLYNVAKNYPSLYVTWFCVKCLFWGRGQLICLSDCLTAEHPCLALTGFLFLLLSFIQTGRGRQIEIIHAPIYSCSKWKLPVFLCGHRPISYFWDCSAEDEADSWYTNSPYHGAGIRKKQSRNQISSYSMLLAWSAIFYGWSIVVV